MTVRSYAPGRTEIAGNHTDHQGGRAIAAAVDCGVEMVLEPNGSSKARVESEGFAPAEIDVGDLQPHPEERGSTSALVRGVVAGLAAAGVEPRGFTARARSTVPAGGGLSSSAAFELALAVALVHASGAEAPAAAELAKIGQMAERNFFGKPCGLLDQLAIALGGIADIDFADASAPRASRIAFDFERCGYALCLIDTHCDHSRYTQEYAQVARDMFDVADLFGARMLSQVPEGAFLDGFQSVRRRLGDLPALRALHYYHEMRLVDARSRALAAGDIQEFLALTRQSGASSGMYLQNVSTFDRASQPAMVALALADRLLEGHGACRIHGGGFGGSIQAFVPLERVDAFARAIDAQLGEGSCRAYRIDPLGAHAT